MTDVSSYVLFVFIVGTDVDTDNGGNSGTGGNTSESGGGSSDEEQI